MQDMKIKVLWSGRMVDAQLNVQQKRLTSGWPLTTSGSIACM
jgi:hypothetical protein